MKPHAVEGIIFCFLFSRLLSLMCWFQNFWIARQFFTIKMIIQKISVFQMLKDRYEIFKPRFSPEPVSEITTFSLARKAIKKKTCQLHVAHLMYCLITWPNQFNDEPFYDKFRKSIQRKLKNARNSAKFGFGGFFCELPTAVKSVGLCSTSDAITFDQNWHHLYSSFARGKDLSNDTQIREIG